MDRLSPSTDRSSTKRSLNLPAPSAHSFPPVQSALHATSFPPVQSALDATSFPPVQSALDSYSQHPEVATLDQIMLHYLGMEEILKLYQKNYEPFETRQTLGTLSLRFQLPASTTFKQLLRSYDMKYATVRSYLYDNRRPLDILLQAALEGDIQAMYNQLKLYPWLRKHYIYTQALEEAAEGGHRAIMDLLLELGASKKVIFIGAARGGHLTIVKEEIAKFGKEYLKTSPLSKAARTAAANNQREVLDYILSLNASSTVLNIALEGAGISGNAATIEYLIAKGAYNYAELVIGATEGGHFELFKQYYGKVSPNTLYRIFQAAIDNLHLDIVRFLFRRKVVYEDTVVECLGDLKHNYRYYVRQISKPKKLSSNELAELARKRDGAAPIIEYLERHGVTNEESSEVESSEESSD